MNDSTFPFGRSLEHRVRHTAAFVCILGCLLGNVDGTFDPLPNRTLRRAAT
jgi:hypothetical protein